MFWLEIVKCLPVQQIQKSNVCLTISTQTSNSEVLTEDNMVKPSIVMCLQDKSLLDPALNVEQKLLNFEMKIWRTKGDVKKL